LLARIAGNGLRTIIVETASRFARDLMVQEVGFAKLKALGIALIAADSPQSFLDDTPTSKLIRQILGAVSEFDKAMVVAKLKGARDRKRAMTGEKVEGRKSHAESNSLWLWSVNCAAGARRVASDHCVTSPQSLRHADI
jgi:DNA invertase Pin-like site-specific DNA recombinase